MSDRLRSESSKNAPTSTNRPVSSKTSFAVASSESSAPWPSAGSDTSPVFRWLPSDDESSTLSAFVRFDRRWVRLRTGKKAGPHGLARELVYRLFAAFTFTCLAALRFAQYAVIRRLRVRRAAASVGAAVRDMRHAGVHDRLESAHFRLFPMRCLRMQKLRMQKLDRPSGCRRD